MDRVKKGVEHRYQDVGVRMVKAGFDHDEKKGGSTSQYKRQINELHWKFEREMLEIQQISQTIDQRHSPLFECRI